MTHLTASRLGALVVALAIALTACSDSNPVATQFPQAVPATGVVTFIKDPSIFDILVSSCDATEIPASVVHSAPWQDADGAQSIELSIGCYDIKVVRLTALGLASQTYHVVLNGGDVYFVA